MAKAQNPQARTNVLVSELDDEIVVYDLDLDQAATLNGTAAAVWRHCDGTNDTAAIAKLVSDQMGVESSVALVEYTIRELASQQLLANGEAATRGHPVLARRQALRAIGLGTALAIPTIKSVAAPAAAAAASCLPNPTSVACPTDGAGCVLITPTLSRCPNSLCCTGCCVALPGNPASGNCASGTCAPVPGAPLVPLIPIG